MTILTEMATQAHFYNHRTRKQLLTVKNLTEINNKCRICSTRRTKQHAYAAFAILTEYYQCLKRDKK